MSLHLPSYLYVAIPLLILFLILKPLVPKLLGHRGESTVRARLVELDNQRYIVLNDLLITNLKSRSKMSQIDHVVISQYGVFVIETKNYSGRIMGKASDSHWTQVIYRRKERMVNPLRQNYGHVQAMKEVINETVGSLSPESFISIVAFTGNSELMVQVEPGTHVIHTRDLTKTISQYRSVILSAEQVKRIASLLQAVHIADTSRRREHVARIRSSVSTDRRVVKSGICPRCGSALVTRRGKHGSFRGCSAYPKCRFTGQV